MTTPVTAQRSPLSPKRTSPEARGSASDRSAAEYGFATVTVLALMAVLVSFAWLVALLGSVAVTRHRAASAADLAALAGAAHALEGADVACRRARRIATAHSATVRSCTLDGATLLLEVGLTAPGPLARWGQVHARARAGPR